MRDGNLNTMIYSFVKSYSFHCYESSGGSKEGTREPLPLILCKKAGENNRKEKSRQGRKQAKQQPPSPSALLAQGLYPLLVSCTGSSDIIMD